MIKNNIGDSKSPCLNPLEVPKKISWRPIDQYRELNYGYTSVNPEKPPNSLDRKLSQYQAYR